MNKTNLHRNLLIAALAILGLLAGLYFIRPNRWATKALLIPKNKQTANDYMLSSLNVTSIAQDSKKLMWIGTSAGINVYNGQDYIQFFHDPQDTTALPDDYINVLHRDKRGRMWVGTQNGLARYEGGYRFHRIALPTTDGNILSITDEAQNIVASNGKERFLINGKDEAAAITTKQPATGCFSPSHHGLPYSNDTLSPRLTQLFPNLELALQKPKQLISTTFKDAGGNLWIGFRNAGYQVVSENLIAYKLANDNQLATTTQGKDITCLTTVGSHILAGTTLRLYVYGDPKESVTPSEDHQPQDFYYKDLFQGDAAAQLNNAVAYDANHVWLVGNHQILSCHVAASRITPQNSISSPSPIGTGARQGEYLYASCQSPHIIRYRFGSSQAENIPFASRWYDDETQLTALHDGSILLFMKDMHFALLSPKSLEIKEFCVKSEGNIDPAFVHQDSRGEIWLGTKRSGLYRLDIKQKKASRMNFVSDVHIQGLQEDNLHQIWITTLKDAICYQPATGAVLMNSLVSSSQNEWNRQYFDNSLCLSPKGTIVLGSSDGCIFLPQEAGDKMLIANKRPIDRTSTSSQQANSGKHTHYDQSRALEKGLCIYALDIKTKDGDNIALREPVKDAAHYTLAYDENDLTLNFFYPNYSRRSSLTYQYKLEGMDKEWHDPTYRHTAHFANLSPGQYTFRLRMVSSPDLPPLAGQSVTFTILPAPWFSAAAWWLYGCCLAMLIYYINSLYLRIRTNRLLLLQEQHEREREQHTNEMNMSFFANISHEFRNPITIIAGPLLALKTDTSLPAAVLHTLDRVCLSVNRMLRLIDQMLDFNQLETDALRLKVAHVDAREELRQLLATFEESTHLRGIRLETVFAEGNYDGWMDTDKMEKIMSNLFTNALKHTANQGVIRIAIGCGNEKDAPSSNHGETEGNINRTLNVSIWNNGEKIAEDKLQDVFKRYYQLPDTQGSHHYGWGTGIGLYYVKRLVGLHHGEIAVRNISLQEITQEPSSTNSSDETDIPMQGVEFRFSLPIDKEVYKISELVERKTGVMQIPVEVKGEERREKNPTADKDETENKELSNTASPVPETDAATKPKLLIVDDDVDVAQYIRSIFARDYIVENRYSAEEALADLDQVRPDIIMSDIIMGEMSGYDFCKTLKSNLTFSHIPVILITAKSNMNEQIAGLRLGAVAYITKPFDPFYLKALVETQLHNMATLRQRLGESTATETLAEQEADTLSDQDRKFMDELYSLMERRSAEMELSVTTICHDLLISQSKFNYKLKELTGDTPGTFFRKYKLNKAAQWLKEGKYNVSEVAVMTGFSTAAHFSVAFKKQFGVSPSEFL